MPHARLIETMNTPDAGRFLTQSEFNNMLEHAKLEAVAVLWLGAQRHVTEAEVRDVMFERQMEMTVYGCHLRDLKSAARASSKSVPMYAEEILRDAQDAFTRELFTTGQCLVNQARWVLATLTDEVQS